MAEVTWNEKNQAFLFLVAIDKGTTRAIIDMDVAMRNREDVMVARAFKVGDTDYSYVGIPMKVALTGMAMTLQRLVLEEEKNKKE